METIGEKVGDKGGLGPALRGSGRSSSGAPCGEGQKKKRKGASLLVGHAGFRGGCFLDKGISRGEEQTGKRGV